MEKNSSGETNSGETSSVLRLHTSVEDKKSSEKTSSALSLLTSVGGPPKAYNGFSKLQHGYHKIECFRLVKNKYNENNEDEPSRKRKKLERVLLIELKDEVLFLPEYFAAVFNNDEAKVEELNNDGIVKYLYFGGKRHNNK